MISDTIPWLEWLDYQSHVNAMKNTAKELDAVIANWLEEHLKKRTDGELGSDSESDFMDVMISNLAEGPDQISGFSRDVVIKATALVRFKSPMINCASAQVVIDQEIFSVSQV